MQGYAAGMRLLGQRLLGRAATGSIETDFKYGRNKMNDNKRLNNYDELPLVLDVADIRRIMGISRVSAYEQRLVLQALYTARLSGISERQAD